MIPVVSTEAREKRATFFQILFEGLEGYLCIGAKITTEKRLVEEFFRWPEQAEIALNFIEKYSSSHNMYFCSTLLRNPKRVKNECIEANFCWADLDSCRPELIEEAAPTIVLETSPNRYQALWRLAEATAPWDVEDINRRIAYKYEAEGCDKSGHDLTQLLRIPFTYNHKYAGMGMPTVQIAQVNQNTYSLEELQAVLPQVAGYEALEIPMPDESDLPTESAEDIMQNYRKMLQPLAFSLFSTEPEKKKWSEALWQLEMFCLEAGMSMEETFVVARESACNKYRRDKRDMVMLWKEVCRAKSKFDQTLMIQIPKSLANLLTDEEREAAAAQYTLIDEYMDWAKKIGDAAPQYHQAGAFIILSSLLAGPVRLPTSFGTMLPNLWFMIMADTTLTRKSTAMDLAMDIVVDIDPDAIMATDGSIEGLLTTLQHRSGRPSVFLRDEFSGLLEAMTHRDYYAGMAETFTKLYDGKFQKRVLRKEIIEIREPVLILFAGGIRERILQLLTHDQVSSGFLPRFVFITAESDTSRLRPLGPPTDAMMEGRSELVDKFREIHNKYSSSQIVVVAGKEVATAPEHHAQLTGDAWQLYNRFEQTMLRDALDSEHPDLVTPTFDRLCKSGLKASVLLAALRMEDNIVVQEADVLKAFYYVEQWRVTAVEVLNNIGRTTTERQLATILKAIQREPEGLLRSKLMQRYHLNAKDTEQILMTLEQRGSIQRIKHGRTERLYPTVIPNQYV